jgi:hypothetical protein
VSLNRILNRPMFRREALRKGHLKPIKARTGRSIIGPMQPPVPAVIPKKPLGIPVGPSYNYALALRKQPTFFERMGTGAKSLGRGLFSIPAIGGFYAGDKVAQAMGINDPVGRTAAGFGGSYLATKALPGLASLPGMVSAGLIAGPAYLMYAGSKERERIKNMSPEERAAHKSKAMQFGTAGYLDDEMFNQQFGKIDPTKLDEIVKKPRTTIPNPGSGRPGSKRFEQKQEDVATAPDNVTKFGKTKVIDTAKIAENTIPNIDSGRGGDSASAVSRQNAMPPPEGQDPKEKGTTDTGQEDKETKGKGTADLDTINADSPFKAQLDLARQIAKEMRQGKTSQAKMVFLSNLASGLLTGTTRKGGLGGALEVFGAALGPAVNNMVMVKMKEDEIEQNLLGRALEFSTDFLKAQNQAFEMPDTENVGVIQYTNKAGRIVNVPGRILKDGTKQMASGAANPETGLYTYVTVDPSLNFISQKDMNKETLDLAKSIAGKYAAVNLINRSLGIIQSGGAQAGVTGAIGLYGGRLSEALGDVLSFAKIGGDSKAELKAAGQAMFNIEQKKVANALVAAGEFENSNDALKYLNSKSGLGNFQKNYNDSIRNAKKRLKDGSTLDYERLAINETVLVYKLANSLKAKDRLTQKDIEMAKGLVKVFPLLRGEINVMASLTATAETILDDIKQQERLYERAGGSSQYLLNERKAYGLLPDSMTIDTMTDFESKKFRDLQEKIEKMTDEDFDRIFPPEFFK